MITKHITFTKLVEDMGIEFNSLSRSVIMSMIGNQDSNMKEAENNFFSKITSSSFIIKDREDCEIFLIKEPTFNIEVKVNAGGNLAYDLFCEFLEEEYE